MYGTPTRASNKRSLAAISQDAHNGRSGTPRSLTGSTLGISRTPRGHGRRPRDLSVFSANGPETPLRRGQSVLSVASSLGSGAGGSRIAHSIDGSSIADEGFRDFAPETDGSAGPIRRNTVLARDDVFRVFVNGEVPKEVRQILNDADLYIQHFRAELDATTGFAYVTTAEACYVWNFVKRTSSPTCYTFTDDDTLLFPLSLSPPDEVASSTHMAPLALLVPPTIASSAEPGLIVLGAESGVVRYWENVSLALVAGYADKASEMEIDLGEDEQVVGLSKIQSGIFAAATSTGRVMRLSISTAHGRSSLQLEPFTRPASSLFSFSGKTNNLFNSLPPHTTVGISSFTNMNEESTITYVAAGSNAQRWIVNRAGQQLVNDVDVTSLPGIPKGRASILDVAAVDASKAAVLFGFPLPDGLKQEFVVAVIEFGQPEVGSPSVELVLKLGYHESHVLRRIDGPRLLVAGSMDVAYVKFPEAVVSLSLRPEYSFEQVTPFKTGIKNDIIGVGLDIDVTGRSRITQHNKIAPSAKLFALSTATGVLCFEVSPDKLRTEVYSSRSHSANLQLQAKIEQAVFFDTPHNPISFNLHDGFQGSLELAVLAVSKQIVASGSVYSSSEMDITHSLADRRLRLQSLNHFIQNNGQLDQISLDGRHRLANDIQIIAAANALWDHLNEEDRMSSVGSNTPISLLGDAILAYMTEVSSGSPDPIRKFFRSHPADIPTILHHARETLDRKCGPKASIESKTQWQISVNGIFDAAYRSAISEAYDETKREYNLSDGASDTPIWLTDLGSKQDLGQIYHKTSDLLVVRTAQYGSIIDESSQSVSHSMSEEHQNQTILRDQLCSLVQPYCFVIEMQAKYAAYRIEQRTDQGEADKRREEYTREENLAIMSLVPFRTDLAYQMAEYHRQYATLVELATSNNTGDPSRVERYMHGVLSEDDACLSSKERAKTASKFADALFQHYLSSGQLHLLLNQNPTYYPALHQFFSRRPNLPHLAFIQHLAENHVNEAALDLMKAAGEEERATSRKVYFSLAKLAGVAGRLREGHEDKMMVDLDVVDDELYLIDQTQKFAIKVSEVVKGSRPDSKVDIRASAYMKKRCHGLTAKPESSNLLSKTICKLLEGLRLDYDEVIDLLISPDTQEETPQDLLTALQIFKQIPTPTAHQPRIGLPDSKRSDILRAIWRSIYLRDDWSKLCETANLTDEQLHARLETTVLAQVIQGMRLQGISLDYLLTPENVVYAPSFESMRSRNEELDYPAYVEEVQEDIQRVKEMIENAQLDRWVQSLTRA